VQAVGLWHCTVIGGALGLRNRILD